MPSVAGDSAAGRLDFFISYTSADTAWATWIAQELEAAGYRVLVQAWDFRPGHNFLTRMSQGIQQARRLLLVLSSRYVASAYATAEWQEVYHRDVLGEAGLLVPVRVEDCEPPTMLRGRIYVDLAGLDDEQTARETLLAGVAPGRARPGTPVRFPGRAGQVFPGRTPKVSNLPIRSPVFTGRTQELAALDQHLAPGQPVAVVAVQGLGGVGKTQLAIEYAHRYLTELEVIWWVQAETPLTIAADLAALAPRLGLPLDADQEAMVASVLAELRTRRDWLLVFDNAGSPHELAGFLPGGSGRVVITSRWRDWGGLAHPLGLDVLPRAEAVAFLLARTRQTDRVAADQLAEQVGDLPLALAQLAAYLARNDLSLAKARVVYQRAEQRLLAAPPPVGYPKPVAVTWQLHFDQLAARAPAAVALLRLCAFLAPDGIPLELLLDVDPALLPEELATSASDLAERAETVGALAQTSLLTRLDEDQVRIHRLVQAVTRHRLNPEQTATWITRTIRLVEAVFPSSPWEPAAWPTASLLLPHAQAITILGEQHQTEPAATAVLLTRTGQYLHERGELTAARKLYERAVTIVEHVYGRHHSGIADILNSLGIALRELGELPEARSLLERTLAIQERADGVEHPRVADTLANLGMVLTELGELREARASLERAVAIQERVHGADHRLVAGTLANLAIVLRELGELREARALLERALAIQEQVSGLDYPNICNTLNSLGAVMHDLGDMELARQRLERALAIHEHMHGPDHPQVAITLSNLSGVLLELGERSLAPQRLEHALAIQERVYGPDHPQVAATLINLGGVLHDLGNKELARQRLERAVAIYERVDGPDHPQVAIALRNLGKVLRGLGETASARDLLERALLVQERVSGPKHLDVAYILIDLGIILHELGELREARALLERALDIQEHSHQVDHPQLIRTLSGLGIVLGEMGERRVARQRMEQLLGITQAAWGADHPLTHDIATRLRALGDDDTSGSSPLHQKGLGC